MSVTYSYLPKDTLCYIYDIVIHDERKQDAVYNLALINKISRDAIDLLYKNNWTSLKDWFFSKEFFIVYDFMKSIETSTTSPQSLFKKLRADPLKAFCELPYFPNSYLLMCNGNDMETSFQLTNDEALCAIWPRINKLLPEEFQKNNLRAAAEIRNYINDFENITGIMDTIQSIKTLDFSSLELNVLPPELRFLTHLESISLHPNYVEINDINNNYVETNDDYVETNDINDDYVETDDNYNYSNHFETNDTYNYSDSAVYFQSYFQTVSSYHYYHNIRFIPLQLSLGNLKELNLSNNSLETHHFSAFDLSGFYNLTTLNLEYNKIKEIPESIFNLPSIEIITLNNNEIKEITDFVLNFLRSNTTFKQLRMYCNLKLNIRPELLEFTSLSLPLPLRKIAL